MCVTDGVALVYQEVTIQVEDVNDETPKMSHTSYTGVISETPTNGDAIAINAPIAANDDDLTNPNNLFTFSIQDGNVNDAFTIDV